VTQGATVVSEAEQNMHEIVSGASVVSKLMDEIAVSTVEQEKGISQITLALSELEKVTQSNVTMVEELAGSSDILKNRVIELQARTSKFRLAENQLTNVDPVATDTPSENRSTRLVSPVIVTRKITRQALLR
jgi:enoyl reductase-like protein